ncbi:MAG: hypothetical protein ACKOCN_04190, partial [Planctomycetaceae bacterium]
PQCVRLWILAAVAGVVPTSLVSWGPWVLLGQPSVSCPSPYYSGTERIRVWPSTLAIECGADGGTWKLKVRAFDSSWLPLPGDAECWPGEVTVDGEPVAVVGREGVPSLKLSPGVHAVAGSFSWREAPEKLGVPPSIGIVTLVNEGRAVAIPDRDTAGRLWLRRSPSAQQERDAMSLTLARVLEDGSPIWLRSEIELNVSGRSREEDLGCILPDGWELSHVDGPIPVAIDDAGRLRAQVRAGSWRITIDAFRTTDLDRLSYPDGSTPAAAVELVALRQRNDGRAVEFANATPIDASLTTFPERWRGLPVFRWKTDESLEWLVKAKASDVRQPDRFRFDRRLWLDDDGRGVTYEDTISGECRSLSRLDSVPDHELGVVRIDGERQLITRSPDDGASGVELRTPRPAIQAIGRTRRAEQLAAVGWRADAESLSIGIDLPPGWRTLAVFGADRVEGDWLTAWTLLDLFLLLVFALAVEPIYGLTTAVLAFIAFALSYHEPGAPRFTWLFLLVPLALLRVVSSSKGRRWLEALHLVALGLLLLHLIPFVAREIQTTLYPQLEEPGIHYRPRTLVDLFEPPSVTPRMQGPAAFDSFGRGSLAAPSSATKRMEMEKAAMQQTQAANMQYAPGTSTQTGIARPEWDGTRVVCAWDGPVAAGQTLRPVLIPASIHRLLAVARVALLLGLLARLVRNRRRSPPGPPALPAFASAGVAVLMVFGSPIVADAQSFPDAALLDALKQRLLAPSDAFPRAAEIPDATLTIEGNRLRIEASIHAAVDCAVPVPGRLPAWSPVGLRLDDADATICRRQDGHLWIWVPGGVHSLVTEGLLPDVSEWVWSFHLAQRRVRVVADDWTVTGVDGEGRPQGEVVLTRRQAEGRGVSGYDQRF